MGLGEEMEVEAIALSWKSWIAETHHLCRAKVSNMEAQVRCRLPWSWRELLKIAKAEKDQKKILSLTENEEL